MESIATSGILRTFSPLRLAGPIFDKELRVASRRRRTYLLRFLYIGALTLFVAQVLVVATAVTGAGSSVVQVAQVGQAASRVVSSVLWFEFLLAQLLAIVLLGGSIGNEIRQRSLDVLLTTPISSLQIVLGKFAGGLFQLVLLLAVSLPLLAVVRVYGGVPWDHVVLSLCVIGATALFCGSLSLLLSVTNRHAYRVITSAAGVCVVLWAGSAALVSLLRWANTIGNRTEQLVLYLTNPFYVMGVETASMATAMSSRVTALNLWPVHCLILLAGAGLMLLLAVHRLRRVALAPAPGPRGETAAVVGGRHESRLSGSIGFHRRSTTIRRVKGSPIFWKELHRPLFQRRRRSWLDLVIYLLLAGLVVSVAIRFSVVGRGGLTVLCGIVAVLLYLLFFINVASSAASAIAREKEARTLTSLLTSPLSSGRIIRDKVLGGLCRNLLLLIPIPFLAAFAYSFTPINLAAISLASAPMLIAIVSGAGEVALLMGIGLCLSVYLRTVVPAVVATFAIYIGFKLFSGAVGGAVLVVAMGMGLLGHDPGAPGLRLVMAVLHVSVFGGLGVLLMWVAAAGLRRHCL